jgi:hypothetical protein
MFNRPQFMELNLVQRRIGFAYLACRLLTIVLGVPTSLLAQKDLIQIKQDFSADPRWEGVNNRVVCNECPTIVQDFGWRAGKGISGPTGEIAGTIWRSRTPAYYATNVGPFSFNDKLSASGQIAVMPANRVDGFYFGFFNAARQEWRPWSSIAIRIGDIRSHVPLASEVIVDYMSQGWKAGGYTAGTIPVDGRPHRWILSYEPDVTVPTEWVDAKLRNYIGTDRKSELEIFQEAQEAEPGIKPENLLARLQTAHKLGLVVFETRRGVGWEIRKNPQDVKGRILFKLDSQPQQAHFIDKSIRDEPAAFDRFGVFNFQLPGGPTRFSISALAINGMPVDLTKDPGWEGKGNRDTFVEHDFHARQDFGYSATNFAGKSRGEIGGTFWRTEPIDPLHAYYADDIGELTLEDPISFSGQIAFTAGGTDAGMMFGYFNTKDVMANLVEPESGAPLPQTMMLAIEGPTRIGYQLSAQLAPSRQLSSHSDGPIFVPDGRKHRFTFQYDPQANKGVGRITMGIDDVVHTLDVSPQQRAAGARFNRFGLMNIRRGGKYVTVYFDDLNYTARRMKDYQPKQHEQSIVRVPYPENGRKY